MRRSPHSFSFAFSSHLVPVSNCYSEPSRVKSTLWHYDSKLQIQGGGFFFPGKYLGKTKCRLFFFICAACQCDVSGTLSGVGECQQVK